MSRDDILKLPVAELFKGAKAKADAFVIESEEHARGVLNRVYRLEALLRHAVKFIPRFDNDGRPQPLHQVIETELQGDI